MSTLVTEMLYRYEHDGAMPPPPIEKQEPVVDTTQQLVPVQSPDRKEEELQGVKKVHFTSDREQSPLLVHQRIEQVSH